MITKNVSLGLIFLAVFYATIAYGQAYKCRNANGQLIYGDSPCSKDSKTEKIIPFTASPGVTRGGDNAVAQWKEIKKARSQREKIEQQRKIMQEQKELQEQAMQAQQQEQQEQIAPRQLQKEVARQYPQEERLQSAGSQKQLQEAQNQHNKKVEQAQQQQQREVLQAQQQQQAVMRAQQQQQQQKLQESQRLTQELQNSIPTIMNATKNAGTSGAAVRDAMLQMRVDELNKTAKHGVQIQIQGK